MAKLNCQILTSNRTVVNTEVDRVVARGICGEFAVEPGHIAFLTPLKTSVLRTVDNGNEEIYALYGGFLEVRDDAVRILVDACEHSDEIDMNRAEEAKRRAEERLKRKSGDTEVDRAERALYRAINRIKASSAAK